jgi:hypothetical protein
VALEVRLEGLPKEILGFAPLAGGQELVIAAMPAAALYCWPDGLIDG